MKEVDSIQDLIQNFLLKNKERPLIFSRRGYRTYSITGEELLEKVNKLRVFFKNKGIKKGDKIIIFGMNSIELIAVFYACILSGIIIVPIDVLANKTFLRKIQKQVKAKAIFQDKMLVRLDGVKKYYFDELDDMLDNVSPAKIENVKINKKDVLEIIYTSGTTGDPKGVILTNENLTSGINSAAASVSLKLRIKMLDMLPLSHIFSQVYGLFFSMYFNHKLFFIDSLHAKKIVSFIKNKKINAVVVTPGMLETLRKELEEKSLSANLGIRFRLIGIGGASLDPELEDWWRKKKILILQGYGLTETSSIVSVNNLFMSKFASVGKIAKGVEVKLGKDEEILVKGKNVTSGYYEDKEKTRQSFEKGWFKTGDVGFIKNNHLYLKERKKDIIVTSGGLNVYPIDIENILKKVDGVSESCVLDKDGKIHAVFILNKKVNLSKVVEDINKKLLSHQKIDDYSIWPYDNFPKTPMGKIKKFIVLDEISKKTEKKHSYENKIYNIVNNVLKSCKKITDNSKLTGLGMDSLKRIELISALENEFNTEIDELNLDQHTKVKDLNGIIKEGLKRKIKFKKWPLSFISKIIRKLGQWLIVFPVSRFFTYTEFIGLENLKDIKEPVIIASNHQSAWDVVVLLKKLKLKTAIAAESDYVFGIGTKTKKVYRRFTGFLSYLFFNCYPFGPSIGTNKSLEFTGELIDRGYSILIFPEGQRTFDGSIQEFRSGVGYLALHMNTLVIPIRIRGLFEILPYPKIIPKFGKTSVNFGKPITLKELRGLSYIGATKLIKKRIEEL